MQTCEERLTIEMLVCGVLNPRVQGVKVRTGFGGADWAVINYLVKNLTHGGDAVQARLILMF
jgi:hypothetical protein